MKVLEKETAVLLLEELYLLNKGPWREHSYNVTLAAKKIAEKTSSIDPDKAYTLGLIHNIGR